MKKYKFIILLSVLFMIACDQSVEYEIPVITNCNLEIVTQSNLPVSNYIVKLYTQYKPDVVIDQKTSNLQGKAEFGSLAPGDYAAKVFASESQEMESFSFLVSEIDSLNTQKVQLSVNISQYNLTVQVKEDLTDRIIKNRKVTLTTDQAGNEIVAESITDSDGKVTFGQINDYFYYINVYDPEGSIIAKQTHEEIGRNSNPGNITLLLPPRILHNADFVISGMMVNLKGYDCKDVGFRDETRDITFPGEFEYVQFVALKDIDFSVTPYCMVTCWNGTPTTLGWVEGKNNNRTTYQINIDEGTVKKGEFFYVGGRSRLLCGINEYYISPSISADKWIVTKNFYSEVGDDGNGAPTGGYGILDGGGEVDGVAVFRGTSIDENTVPMDAVFFGSSVSLTHYYQVPNNDLYNRINQETNEGQPYFSMGTNTTTMGKSLGDVGDFYILGGKVTPEAWLIPRVPDQHVRLNWKEITPQLSDIEVGPMITKFSEN